jgi:hypothetical protein
MKYDIVDTNAMSKIADRAEMYWSSKVPLQGFSTLLEMTYLSSYAQESLTSGQTKKDAR